MTEIKRGNIIVIKNKRKIIGFIEIKGDKFYYSFSKPSAPQYIAFETDTLEKARNRILENHRDFIIAISA